MFKKAKIKHVKWRCGKHKKGQKGILEVNRYLTKENMKIFKKVYQKMIYLMSSRNFKLKQQCATTTNLMEWPKFKILTAPKAGKDVDQQELSFIAGRSAK